MCCLLNSATAFVLTAPPATSTLRSTGARMQTATPDTITKVPDTLPSSWSVPDTLPSRFSGIPPLFRLTLFNNGKKASYITEALLEVHCATAHDQTHDHTTTLAHAKPGSRPAAHQTPLSCRAGRARHGQ